MKERYEVEQLKINWREQPSGEIAATPGFEDYRAELRQFQTDYENAQRAKESEKLQQEANKIGLGDRLVFAKYFNEAVLEQLEEHFGRLEAINLTLSRFALDIGHLMEQVKKLQHVQCDKE